MVLVDAECTHDGSVKHIQKFEFWQSADGWPCRSGLEPQNLNMLQGCRSVDEFERLNTINEGTYGIVSRAKDLKTGETVALKKVKMEKEREGFPINVAWTAFTLDLWASVFGLRNVKDTRGKRRALVC